VIAAFKDKEAERLFKSRRASKRLLSYADAALRKLVIIDAATTIADLRNSPGNDLKQIGGTWQVRINRQYRVRFTWDGRDAHDVEIGDFH
jgi:proteic killer suppression protein